MRSVLIVEDDAKINDVFCRYLLSTNEFEVISCFNVRDALTYLRANPAPNIAVVDMELGDGTGFDILEELMQPQYAATARVVASATAYQYWNELQVYKLAHLLIKPVSPRGLSELLKALP
jgi:two-component system, LytTR family, response regulator